ncbi:hypothetical protein DFJ73DRAFT_812802 [Zopfochytrium polystomum]|nr:hypothetical protein DFJ73DRAFT_812802 [Zopfochytrium polystomum]
MASYSSPSFLRVPASSSPSSFALTSTSPSASASPAGRAAAHYYLPEFIARHQPGHSAAGLSAGVATYSNSPAVPAAAAPVTPSAATAATTAITSTGAFKRGARKSPRLDFSLSRFIDSPRSSETLAAPAPPPLVQQSAPQHPHYFSHTGHPPHYTLQPVFHGSAYPGHYPSFPAYPAAVAPPSSTPSHRLVSSVVSPPAFVVYQPPSPTTLAPAPGFKAPVVFVHHSQAKQQQKRPPMHQLTAGSATATTPATTAATTPATPAALPSPALSTPPLSPRPRSQAAPVQKSIDMKPVPTIPPPSTAVTPVTSGNTRLFHCPHPGCTRAFTRRQNMDCHATTHVGEKKEACSEAGCGAKFRRRQDLYRHERCVHGRVR